MSFLEYNLIVIRSRDFGNNCALHLAQNYPLMLNKSRDCLDGENLTGFF